jgi:succinoglycan biosynthesis protein ExoV
VKLFYYRGRNGVTNFGDELNHSLWRHFLPGAFDHDDGTQFVGIGTLLNDRLPEASRTVIFGTGVGYYGPPKPSANWTVYCVRGPLSAAALGLPDDMAVTDPGALVTHLPRVANPQGPRRKYGFIPHWQSEPRGWLPVCEAIDVEYIDPRWTPERVIEALGRIDVLIAEAMHGAIVADALRIPWIPVRTRPAIKEFKWQDWCRSLDLDYKPCTLPTMWAAPRELGLVGRVRRRVRLKLLGEKLRRVARRERPLLSRSDVLQRRQCQLEDRLALLEARELRVRQVTR